MVFFDPRAGLRVEQLSEFPQQGRILKPGDTIVQIKGIIQVRRIFSLVVLDNGFRLVQSLDQSGFRRSGRVVVFP